ncbi:hypothetical protein SEUCBS140593_005861 [Sporothrix eucalyptigena]|uniref:NmrA-like domain-containing protein n=1 Tax=Sporothrix eucalyptigena TaxID=1812306 RepID=A0ABP0C002_9PEZI
MAIKNVVVAGGSGALGTPIVNELVKSGFNVTVLSREGSTTTQPAGTTVKHVDYKSVDSLKAAIAGQDAVVSVLGSFAIPEQIPLAQAAFAPGSTIKRFIPSEFGVNTRKTPGSAIGKILGAKTQLVDFLTEEANKNPNFKWTGISNGHFFDWGLSRGLFGLDREKRTAKIYDSGNERFQASNLPFVAKAVSAVLQKADTPDDKTANQYFEIASFTPTQNEVLAAAEELTGGDKWTVNRVSSAEVQKVAEDKLSKGDYSVFVDLLSVWQYADGAGHAPNLADPALGNNILGLGHQDVKESVAAWLKE